MTVELVLPNQLAGFRVGDAPPCGALAEFLDDGVEDGCRSFVRYHPEIKVHVFDGVVYSVSVADECWFGGLAVVGSELQDAVELLGLDVIGKERYEVAGETIELWSLGGQLDLYGHDNRVTGLALSNWSLLDE